MTKAGRQTTDVGLHIRQLDQTAAALFEAFDSNDYIGLQNNDIWTRSILFNISTTTAAQHNNAIPVRPGKTQALI